MTPTDLPSPAPDRAVEDVLSEDQAEKVEWCRDWGKQPVIDLLAIIDDLAARLSDALSQPVAQPGQTAQRPGTEDDEILDLYECWLEDENADPDDMDTADAIRQLVGIARRRPIAQPEGPRAEFSRIAARVADKWGGTVVIDSINEMPDMGGGHRARVRPPLPGEPRQERGSVWVLHVSDGMNEPILWGVYATEEAARSAGEAEQASGGYEVGEHPVLREGGRG